MNRQICGGVAGILWQQRICEVCGMKSPFAGTSSINSGDCDGGIKDFLEDIARQLQRDLLQNERENNYITDDTAHNLRAAVSEIGTAILPGLGTAVGGIAGGLILGVAGSYAGSSLGRWVIDITDVGE